MLTKKELMIILLYEFKLGCNPSEATQSIEISKLTTSCWFETFLKPYLNDLDVEIAYYQQDGATWHASGKTIVLL